MLLRNYFVVVFQPFSRWIFRHQKVKSAHFMHTCVSGESNYTSVWILKCRLCRVLGVRIHKNRVLGCVLAKMYTCQSYGHAYTLSYYLLSVKTELLVTKLPKTGDARITIWQILLQWSSPCVTELVTTWNPCVTLAVHKCYVMFEISYVIEQAQITDVWALLLTYFERQE